MVIVGRSTRSIGRNYVKLKKWVAWGSKKLENLMTPCWPNRFGV